MEKADRTKKILVTGGTGFVGSYLLRYLLHFGYRNIRAMRRASSDLSLLGKAADQVEWVTGDVLDPVFLEEIMEGIQQVYHTAAIISFDPGDHKEMMEVNVEGTANVVNAALKADIDKLVHVSSIASLGRSKQHPKVTETTNWVRTKQNSTYAISKYLSEQEVWRAMAEGLDVAIVNPSIILGSGRWEDGPLKLFKLVWNNFPFYSTGATGFVDVRDVARFMVLLMESDIINERFILNAENCTYQQVLNLMSNHLGRRKPSIRITPLAQRIIWRLEWLRTRLLGGKPFITRETAATAVRHFTYINKKSINTLHFDYIPLQETIAAASRQFQEAALKGFESKILPLV